MYSIVSGMCWCVNSCVSWMVVEGWSECHFWFDWCNVTVPKCIPCNKSRVATNLLKNHQLWYMSYGWMYSIVSGMCWGVNSCVSWMVVEGWCECHFWIDWCIVTVPKCIPCNKSRVVTNLLKNHQLWYMSYGWMYSIVSGMCCRCE